MFPIRLLSYFPVYLYVPNLDHSRLMPRDLVSNIQKYAPVLYLLLIQLHIRSLRYSLILHPYPRCVYAIFLLEPSCFQLYSFRLFPPALSCVLRRPQCIDTYYRI